MPQQRPYFRPGADVTRGQLAKIVAIAAGFTDPCPRRSRRSPTCRRSNPFWLWIERVAGQGMISGYHCGGPGEPCDGAARPTSAPATPATRGQTAKIVANTFAPACTTR